MSTLVLTSVEVPEKHLKSKTKLKFHPDVKMKEQIIEEILGHMADPPESDAVVELEIYLCIKKYDTKNTGI